MMNYDKNIELQRGSFINCERYTARFGGEPSALNLAQDEELLNRSEGECFRSTYGTNG